MFALWAPALSLAEAQRMMRRLEWLILFLAVIFFWFVITGRW